LLRGAKARYVQFDGGALRSEDPVTPTQETAELSARTSAKAKLRHRYSLSAHIIKSNKLLRKDYS